MKLVAHAMNRGVIAVDRGLSLREAAVVMRRAEVEHLLVLDGEEIVGVLCGCAFRGAGLEGTVSDRMGRIRPALRPDAKIEEAAAAVAESEVGFLPVALGGLLLGTLGEVELGAAGVDLPAPVRRAPHRHRRRRRPARR